MDNTTRYFWLSYGADALVRELGPAGALLVAAPPTAPAGAPWPLAWVWGAPPDAAVTLAPSKNSAPRFSGPLPASRHPAPAPAPAVGTPVGYPRASVDACVARMRGVNPYMLADAILRTEPFAGAPQLGGVMRNGVLYTGAINPWDWLWLGPDEFAGRPAERGERAIQAARYYAAAIANGNARPRNTSYGFWDRVVESVPTHDRTAAWVNAWARWAVDGVQIALDTPETYDRAAAGVLNICRSWEPTVIR